MHKCPHHRMDVFWQEDKRKYMKVSSPPCPEPDGQAPTFLLLSYHSMAQGLPLFLFFSFIPQMSTLLFNYSGQRIFPVVTGIANLCLLSGVSKPQKGSRSLNKVLQVGRTSRSYCCPRTGRTETVPASRVKMLGRASRWPNIRGPKLGPKGDRP